MALVSQITGQYQLSTTLASDLATDGTIDFSPPAGRTVGHFVMPTTLALSPLHTAVWGGGNQMVYGRDFTLAQQGTPATLIRFTNRGGTIPAGNRITLSLCEPGLAITRSGRVNRMLGVVGPANLEDGSGGVYMMNLGSPLVGSANAFCLAQAIAGAANAVLNGALTLGGVGIPDVPRSLTMVSTGAGDTTQTVTVFGRDAYAQPMVERRTLNGTTAVAFVKAFARIDRVAVSAAMVGNLTLGTGNVLGLPAYLPNAGLIMREMLNGASATAGTTVAGLQAVGSLTSADVRGTYVPNLAPDGVRSFQILAFLPDLSIGTPQFTL
jgi:hypothetical protein